MSDQTGAGVAEFGAGDLDDVVECADAASVGVGYFSLNDHSSGDHADGICREYVKVVWPHRVMFGWPRPMVLLPGFPGVGESV